MKITRTLVCDGGGMKGAFMAGVMAGLRDYGIDYTFFDNYIGTSAGACSMAYFLTGQIDQGLRIWSDHLPNGFIKWTGLVGPKIDMTYLKKILTEIEPLNTNLLAKRAQKAYVALSNVKSCMADYVLLNNAPSPIQVLMASVAMPNYGLPQELNGQFYYDGGLTAQPPLEFADSLHTDQVWVILNRPLGYRVTSLGWKILSWGVKNKSYRKMVAQKPFKNNATLEHLKDRKDLVVIYPRQDLPVHWLTTSKIKINKAIDLGRHAAEELIKTQQLAKL